MIKDITKLDMMSTEELEKLHDEAHVKFNSLLNGGSNEFTFRQLYYYHTLLVNALIRSGGKHVAPIDKLDNIQILEEESGVLENYSHLETKRTLANINYSGNLEGEEIYLKDILKEFKPFKLKEPFVYIVGGLCNHGKTNGDIDILIKKNRPEDETEDIPLKFRILRQLPQKYWGRLHFLYDDAKHGPFTNYVPLYSLTCEVNSKEVFEMSADVEDLVSMSVKEQASKSKSQDKVIPFRFYLQPKPVHGRERGEIYSLESIKETMKSLKDWNENVNTGIYLEKKFDGVRVQIHKVGNRVVVLTEEGTDVTNNIPSIVNEFKKNKNDFVVDAEIELWINGNHQNRADASGILNSKEVQENEKNTLVNLYDATWFNGEDIHTLDFSDRRKFLEKVPDSKHIKKSEIILAKGFDDISRISKRFISLPGSEGVMYKLPNFVYELDGQSKNFMKFKKERSITAKVLAAHKVKGQEDVYYYHMGIEDNTYIGKTFNTKVKANAGDKLEVVFVDLNQYEDPKTKSIWFNWWSPRVIGRSSKPVISVDEAKKIVDQTSGQIGEKAKPKISKEELEDVLEILSASGVAVSREELGLKKKFVFQNHFRGKSVHGDLRFERNGNLEGYTLMYQVAGKIDEPVLSLEDAKREANNSENFKIDLKTGELKQDKIQIATKTTQPLAWISVEGKTEKAEPGSPPEPGATKRFPGVFDIVDKGTYEEGSRKPDYLEYFMDGEIFKGRYVVKLLPSERITKGKSKEPFIWFFWKPKTQSPFILSSRSIKEKFIPPKGKSFMSSEWERKIPKELRWWEKKLSGDKALEMIKEIRKLFLKEDILKEEISSLEEKIKDEFVLKHNFWKGQKVIRDLPVEHWELRIKGKNNFFQLRDSPLNVDVDISSVRKKVESKKNYEFEGEAAPGTSLNPNKKIPATIEIIDKGEVEIISDEENLLTLKFDGKDLKGIYNFRRTTPQTEVWTWSKSKEPGAKLTQEFASQMSDEEVKEIYFLSKNKVGASEIAHKLSRPVQTIYSYLSKLKSD